MKTLYRDLYSQKTTKLNIFDVKRILKSKEAELKLIPGSPDVNRTYKREYYIPPPKERPVLKSFRTTL